MRTGFAQSTDDSAQVAAGEEAVHQSESSVLVGQKPR